MKNDYKTIKPMKEIPDQLRKLRRQFLRYQQAEIVYSLSHKKLLELASDAGAIYRFDSTVLINREIFDAYLERFHEPARKITVEEIDDEDMDFMRHEFVTYSMASDYYGLGLKPVTRMAHECGAIYKIGRKILIRRSIFEEYLRQQRRI